jgi:hypothetical protein
MLGEPCGSPHTRAYFKGALTKRPLIRMLCDPQEMRGIVYIEDPNTSRLLDINITE